MNIIIGWLTVGWVICIIHSQSYRWIECKKYEIEYIEQIPNRWLKNCK